VVGGVRRRGGQAERQHGRHRKQRSGLHGRPNARTRPGLERSGDA
jgi:hypothetical protein